MVNALQIIVVLFSLLGYLFSFRKSSDRSQQMNWPMSPAAELRNAHVCMSQEEMLRRSRIVMATKRKDQTIRTAARPTDTARTNLEELSMREKFLIWKENADKINEMHLRDWERRRLAKSQESLQAV